MKRSIAIIVQRYGNQVNGGAELHARQLAEHLAKTNEVVVLTTCAIDYRTWKSELPEGESFINKVKVLRFKNKQEKNKRLARKSKYALRPRKELIKYRPMALIRSFMPKWKDGELWLQYQGPYCEDLITYLQNNEQNYDVLIFMTYLYYPTVVGLRVAPQKSILIPTAHDEKSIYYYPYKQVFTSPAFIMYNTASEKAFVERLFHNENIPNDIAGVGIEAELSNSPFKKEEYGITGDFILYVGRIARGKVVHLFRNFIRYKRKNKRNLKLVLIGKTFSRIHIPRHPDIISLGFVSDEVKNSAMQAALMLILPSKYESLSMVVLESLYFKTPVLVNGNCEVLVNHCKESGAGFYYKTYAEMEKYLNFALNNQSKLQEMGEKGRIYVQKNYQWDTIIKKYEKAFDLITGSK